MKTEAAKQIYTVKQVNYYIKQIFDGDFILRTISVKGEISNCKYHSSGHIYFSLKDSSGVLSCVMFASAASGLKFRLEDGKQVVVTGNVSVYEAAGRYQLYARKVEEEGKGDLFQKYEELKARLEEAGYFAEEYKQPIPAYASKIGVVTSQTGAVIRDIFNVSSRRNPYVQISLCPAQVQGDGAAESIAAGIRTLDTLGLDVIIIGRGGGSMEDLWAFNEEAVARAIFECRTPLISAVGHETDFTIADFVADLRAPTPSAAAELAVFDLSQFEKDLADYTYSFERILKNRIEACRHRVKNYRLQLDNLSPERQLDQKRMKLLDSRDLLDSLMTDALDAALVRKTDAAEVLSSILQDKLRDRKHRLALLSERLSGLSPLKRLAEGYAYVRVDGKSLRSVSQLHEGDAVDINLKDGTALARVEAIHGSDV